MPTAEPLSALTLYTTYHTADEVMILDTVDTTFGSTGTNKRIQFSTLLSMAGVTSVTVGNPVVSGTSAGLLYDSAGTLACTANLLVNDSNYSIGGNGSQSLAMPSSGCKLSYNGTNFISIGNGATSFSAYFQQASTDFGPASSGANRTLGASLPFLSVSTQNLYAQALDASSNWRNCGLIVPSYNNSTDASWTGTLSLYAGDYTSSNAGQRLGVQIQS